MLAIKVIDAILETVWLVYERSNTNRYSLSFIIDSICTL